MSAFVPPHRLRVEGPSSPLGSSGPSFGAALPNQRGCRKRAFGGISAVGSCRHSRFVGSRVGRRPSSASCSLRRIQKRATLCDGSEVQGRADGPNRKVLRALRGPGGPEEPGAGEGARRLSPGSSFVDSRVGDPMVRARGPSSLLAAASRRRGKTCRWRALGRSNDHLRPTKSG